MPLIKFTETCQHLKMPSFITFRGRQLGCRFGSRVLSDEKSGLGLKFAVLVDASASWHGIKVTPAIGQELEGIRKNSGQNLRVNGLPEKVIKNASLSVDKFQEM